MRFWIVDVPALIVTTLFRAYLITLSALTLLCFLTVLYSIAAILLDWPRIW